MNLLGIFTKHPVAGRVKTRLGAECGAEWAAALYAAFVADLADRFRWTADRRLLCYAPDNRAARDYFAALAGGDYDLWPQPSLSLGERMAAFFQQAFSRGARRVVVIGSDSPTLPGQLVQEAFQLLDNHDCVLGPATDGGYYLIGQGGQPFSIFDDVHWSDSCVLEQTVAQITSCGAGLALLPPWYDVDTIDDLNLLRGHVRALRRADNPINLDHTEPLLAKNG